MQMFSVIIQTPDLKLLKILDDGLEQRKEKPFIIDFRLSNQGDLIDKYGDFGIDQLEKSKNMLKK